MQKLLITKAHKIFVTDSGKSTFTENNRQLVATFNAELMNLGFILSQKAFDTLVTFSQEEIVKILSEVVPVLKELKGDHVEHKPMYKNFPQEVIAMSDLELYVNAIIHYWSFGEWSLASEVVDRGFAFESVKFNELDLGYSEDVAEVINKIIASKDSISDADREYVKEYLDTFANAAHQIDTSKVTYKENLCFLAALYLERNIDISNALKTATDVLRFATVLSGGDVSLSENTKFKSFKRSIRRQIVTALDNFCTVDDIARNREKFKRLFHSLHIGEFTKQAPKINRLAKAVRENEALTTYNSRIENAIKTKNLDDSIMLLSTRPGEFHRRLDHLLRTFPKGKTRVLEAWQAIADRVPPRLHMQMIGHMKNRADENSSYVIFPKGKTQRGLMIDRQDKPLSATVRKTVTDTALKSIVDQFATRENLGKVYIDEALKDCPMPSQQRSASEGVVELARGTRFHFGDKKYLRLFVHWKGVDIDLSASFHNEDFDNTGQVSYTNLRDSGCYHSGDIVDGSRGATEYIDIDIDKAINSGHRYVIMDLRVFSGPNFIDHETCFAGWMSLDNPTKNKQFVAKSVYQKVDLTQESRNAVPVCFDLVERKAIWLDLTSSVRCNRGGNNLESNRISTQQMLKLATSKADVSFNLYDLFTAHAKARGEAVDNKDEADIVFSMNGDVTPFDVTEINANYL